MHFLTLLLATFMAMTAFAIPAVHEARAPNGWKALDNSGWGKKGGKTLATKSAAYTPWSPPMPTQSATHSVQHKHWKRALPTPEAQVLRA